MFLVRSLLVGGFKVAGKAVVSLKDLGATLLREVSLRQGTQSEIGIFTKLRRFAWQDLANYTREASTLNRILGEHFRVLHGKGERVMFEMHHWLIQHAWFAGKNPVGISSLRTLLQRLGNANWNLIPLPGAINRELGASAMATASFAQKLGSTIKAEAIWFKEQFDPLIAWAKE